MTVRAAKAIGEERNDESDDDEEGEGCARATGEGNDDGSSGPRQADGCRGTEEIPEQYAARIGPLAPGRPSGIERVYWVFEYPRSRFRQRWALECDPWVELT